jgi:hypothetical protein
MIRLTQRPSGIIEIVVDKQKDEEEAQPIQLKLKRVALSVDAETGDDITSAVLVEALDGDEDDVDLGFGAQAALLALAACDGGACASGEWRKSTPEMLGFAVAERTFYNWKDGLLESKHVEHMPGKDHWYQLTPTGTATAKVLQAKRDGSWASAAATAPPPKGAGVQAAASNTAAPCAEPDGDVGDAS